MSAAAVICELNPPHNGHKYIFDRARKLSGSDHVVALMSGNYVQRGEPALIDKYERTRMALLMGADLVLELPSPFFIQSGREFAMAGVSLAKATGIIGHLCFGAEFPEGHTDKRALKKFRSELFACSELLLNETEAYKNALRAELSLGTSYPRAAELALSVCGFHDAGLLSSPNNILAREYIRALMLLDADIEPLIVPRIGDGYNEAMPRHKSLVSATALRDLILKGAKAQELSSYVPFELHESYAALIDGSYRFMQPDDLSDILSLRLLSAAYEHERTAERLELIYDVEAELSERIAQRLELPLSFRKRAELLKTRNLTYTHISRALLNICLDIRKDEVESAKQKGYLGYIRILGFRRSASELLSALKKRSALPIVSNAASGRELLGRSLPHDQLYYSVQAGKKAAQEDEQLLKNEFQKQIVIV